MASIIRFSRNKETGRSPEQPMSSAPMGSLNGMGSSGVPTPNASESSANTGNTGNTGLTFEQIAQRNRENAERLRKEREKANKNVLRSYRIK